MARAPREAPKPKAPDEPPRTDGRGAAGARTEERTVLFDSRGKRKSESTQIVKAADLEGEALCKLVAVKGPRQGKQFPLRGTELTVGRDERNDVVIPDISVARKHARLRRHAGGWTITALAEDASIRINGLKVDSQPLVSGDLVELGRAELQFIESDPEAIRSVKSQNEQSRDATKPRVQLPPTKRPSSPRIRKVAIACFAVVALSLLAKGMLNRGRPPNTEATQPDATNADNLSPEDLFAAARKEVLAQHWTEAQRLLLLAVKLDPDSAQLRHYLDIVNAEAENQRHFDAAEKALALFDLKTVLAELGAVPPDSLLADQVSAAHNKLDAAVQQQVELARASMAKSDFEVAAKAIEVAQGGDPKNTAASELKAELDAMRSRAQALAKEAAHSEAARATDQRRQSGPIGSARELFRNGDVPGALAMLGQASAADVALARGLQDGMTKAATALREGKAAAEAGDNARAEDLLVRARAASTAIVPNGALATRANESLAGVEDKLGFAARGAGAGDRGFRHFTAAAAADPHDDRARSELKKIEVESHELFVAAYSAREQDPEAAERKFRQVLEMTASGSADHKGAVRWLSQLGNKRGSQ